MRFNSWARRFDVVIPIVDALWKKGISKLVFTRLMNLDGARPQRRADNVVSKPYTCMTFRHMYKLSIALEIPIGEVAELALLAMDAKARGAYDASVKNTLKTALRNEETNNLNSKANYQAKKIGPPPRSSSKWDYDVG